MKNLFFMNISKFSFLLLCVLILFFSCSNEPEGIPEIKAKNMLGNELKLSDIASSIVEIPLETREGIYLKSTGSITKSEEHFYILDIGRIVKFKLDGTYVGEIAKKGEAPDEYLGAYGISYDLKSRSLLVAAQFNQAILQYSEEGELIGSASFPFPFYVNATDNGIWVLSHGGFLQSRDGGILKIMGYRLDSELIISDSMLVKKVPLVGNTGPGRYIHQQYVSSFDDKPGIYYAVIMSEKIRRDTLYTLEKGQLKPYSKFDFDFSDNRKVTYIYEITGEGNYYFITYSSIQHQQSLFVFDRKKNAGYDLKNGITAADGKTYFLHAFGDGDYFYIKRVADETGFELNPIIVWVKLKE